MATRIFLGRPLRESFRTWLKAKSLRDPLPTDETADLAAAIVRPRAEADQAGSRRRDRATDHPGV